jgi:hypothetical protein
MSNVQLIEDINKKDFQCSNEMNNESFNSEISTTSIEIEPEDLIDQNIFSFNKNVKLIQSIIFAIEKLIVNKPNIDINNSSIILFNNDEIPNISIYNYVNRIVEYTNCEDNTLILSLIYLNQIIKKNINLTVYNIHKFLFASILLALKINEDKIYKNEYYSSIAGISLKELNLIEYHFLTILDFQIFIPENIFNYYKNEL